MIKIKYLFLILITFSIFSCDLFNPGNDIKVNKMILTTSLKTLNFEFSNKNKDLGSFKAELFDKSENKVNEKVNFETNLDSSCYSVNANELIVNLDKIEKLGTYKIKAVYDKDIEQEMSFSIFTNEDLYVLYSYVNINTYNNSDNTFVELNGNGDEIKTGGERARIDENVSVVKTGESGILLYVDKNKFGCVDFNLSDNEKNENYILKQFDNQYLIVPYHIENIGNNESLNIEVKAGNLKKDVDVKSTDSGRVNLAKTIVAVDLQKETGSEVVITGDNVNTGDKNENKISCNFYRLSLYDERNFDSLTDSEKEECRVSGDDIVTSDIDYGFVYNIKRCGKYRVESYIYNTIGGKSQLRVDDFVIDDINRDEISAAFLFDIKNATSPNFINVYQNDESCEFNREELADFKIENCLYNSKAIIEYKSSDMNYESYQETILIDKNSTFERKFSGSGNYKIYFCANDNASYGNAEKSDLNNSNAVIREFEIKNAESVNILEWFSETVTSNSDNTLISSKLKASEKVFEVNENAVIKVSIFDKNSKVYKTNFTLSKTQKEYTYSVGDSNKYEIISFVYIPDVSYISSIKKQEIFLSKGKLSAFCNVEIGDSIQDTYDKRRVKIINAKNFNGEERKLSYAWSNSNTIPSSWTLITNGGNGESEYSLYLQSKGKKYLFLKQEPYNENLDGVLIKSYEISLEYYDVKDCGFRLKETHPWDWFHTAQIYLHKNNDDIKGLKAEGTWEYYWSNDEWRGSGDVTTCDSWKGISESGSGQKCEGYFSGTCAFKAYGYVTNKIYIYSRRTYCAWLQETYHYGDRCSSGGSFKNK